MFLHKKYLFYIFDVVLYEYQNMLISTSTNKKDKRNGKVEVNPFYNIYMSLFIMVHWAVVASWMKEHVEYQVLK